MGTAPFRVTPSLFVGDGDPGLPHLWTVDPYTAFRAIVIGNAAVVDSFQTAAVVLRRLGLDEPEIKERIKFSRGLR